LILKNNAIFGAYMKVANQLYNTFLENTTTCVLSIISLFQMHFMYSIKRQPIYIQSTFYKIMR